MNVDGKFLTHKDVSLVFKHKVTSICLIEVEIAFSKHICQIYQGEVFM